MILEKGGSKEKLVLGHGAMRSQGKHGAWRDSREGLGAAIRASQGNVQDAALRCEQRGGANQNLSNGP